MHVTGDLENLGQGTPEDKRYFVTVADERTILHFGSSYGGNALLGKIAHGLRQAAYDGWASGTFLSEQFMLLGITDKQTGKKCHIAGGFPSASGKTNLAMTLSPDALGDRYYVDFYGDDIAWIWVGEDGRLYGMNPENGVFGVAKDTNEKTNPTAIESIAPGTKAIFTNIAWNEKTHEVWFEGRTKNPPADVDGWLDWKGNRIADRSPEEQDDPWAHPNSRFTTTLANVPNIAKDYNEPQGVPIDGIIFGGRTSDREPLIRAITDLAEGVYDGLTLGAEATFAADGLDGQLRYDPMSMRPFMSYPEGAYAAHWLKIIGEAAEQPIFAHVNWFQRDAEDGHFLWPGYRDNLRALLWLMQLKDGEVDGRQDPGRHPADQGRAQHRRPRDRPDRPGHPAHHRHRPLEAGNGLPPGPPGAVRQPPRGDLGRPPPRSRRPRRVTRQHAKHALLRLALAGPKAHWLVGGRWWVGLAEATVGVGWAGRLLVDREDRPDSLAVPAGDCFPVPVVRQRLDQLQAPAGFLVLVRMAHGGRAECGGQRVPDLDHEPDPVGGQPHPQQRQLPLGVVPEAAVGAGHRLHDVGGQLADHQLGGLDERVEAPAVQHHADETPGEAGRGRQGAERTQI